MGAIVLPGTLAAIVLASCAPRLVTSGHGPILTVGAESQYADVIRQVGGRFVTVTSVMSSPNVDPHALEVTPQVSKVVDDARLVVQNGAGYDSFMGAIESADPVPRRQVITVQRLLGLSASISNPHLWYAPRTMPVVARAVASALARLSPEHAGYFRRNAARFVASLKPWLAALARLRRRSVPATAATTEPVADYLLSAAGVRVLTSPSLQLDLMNGVDPAPQAVSEQEMLLGRQRVGVFVYNRQVTDSVTQSFLALARTDRIPVVGVYETMPHGYDYERWMLVTTEEIEAALRSSAERDDR